MSAWWHPSFGATTKNVRHEYDAAGQSFDRPEFGDWHVPGDAPPPRVIARLVRVFQDNECSLTTAELAERFDVPPKAVKRILDAAGLRAAPAGWVCETTDIARRKRMARARAAA